MFYAYLHATPDATSADEVFYVGKGSGDRAWSFGISSGRLSNHNDAVKTAGGRGMVLVGTIPCSSESIAYDLEMGLIKCIARSPTNRLVNKTNGGRGRAGRFPRNWRVMANPVGQSVCDPLRIQNQAIDYKALL